MRTNICYLLAFALQTITADLIYDVAEEKKHITLRCPHSGKGKVTWSRENPGSKVDILTCDGDKTIKHIKDPQKHYSTTADKSLFIFRINVSDSGRYLCNNQPAVELTVIPSGIEIQNVTERSKISLKCPPDVEGSHDPTWSREIAGKQRQISRHVSAVDKTLTIRNVERDDFGLYFCDGKPVIYLNVTKNEKSDEELIYDVAEEKKQITLHCPHSGKGSVTWSRENPGPKVDILTHVDDKTIKHIKDPQKHYSTLIDKSLFIFRINVSDSGRYLCNNQPAVELTVIPSGIKIQNVKERSNISLKCPPDVEGSHDPTWSREIAGKQQQISRHVSTVDKTLTIRNVERDDFGLYFCDGKPVIYLNVTKNEKSDEDLIYDVAEEKKHITLRCPHSGKGNVTWSRENPGPKVDILTCDGDKTMKHIKDPQKHYGTLADKSLLIIRVNVSDSGRYLCNNQPAVELTVIPSGIKIQNVTERSKMSLKCPPDVEGSHDPTWSREIAGKQQQISRHVSTVNKTLTIRNVERGDFGLYFCDGKPVIYLNVTKNEKSDEDSHLLHISLVGISCLICLIIIIIIIYFIRRRIFKSRETKMQYHIYDEIQEAERLQLANAGIIPSVEQDSVYCLASLSGASKETYSTITGLKTRNS
ncbi:uncharacterized protein LOC121628318 [Melanotaenia boesemani]|uniref:uncharacterized protein LOC121628318 n=1 Tax=Melanotaenia boesemani TaxID=1250792 RepID=UPI001C03B4FA|nr:uncharacterized protein LOC121628318 [Melanotaenia boesemani]